MQTSTTRHVLCDALRQRASTVRSRRGERRLALIKIIAATSATDIAADSAVRFRFIKSESRVRAPTSTLESGEEAWISGSADQLPNAASLRVTVQKPGKPLRVPDLRRLGTGC
jgi:hypothetical protein